MKQFRRTDGIGSSWRYGKMRSTQKFSSSHGDSLWKRQHFQSVHHPVKAGRNNTHQLCSTKVWNVPQHPVFSPVDPTNPSSVTGETETALQNKRAAMTSQSFKIISWAEEPSRTDKAADSFSYSCRHPAQEATLSQHPPSQHRLKPWRTFCSLQMILFYSFIYYNIKPPKHRTRVINDSFGLKESTTYLVNCQRRGKKPRTSQSHPSESWQLS